MPSNKSSLVFKWCNIISNSNKKGKKKTLLVIIVGHQKCKLIPISEKLKCEGKIFILELMKFCMSLIDSEFQY